MQWLISKIVPVIIDIIVKLILKWVADQEAQRQQQSKKPTSVADEAPKDEPAQQGWGDKSFRIGSGPGGIV